MKTNLQLHREEQDEARRAEGDGFPWLHASRRAEQRSGLLAAALALGLMAAVLLLWAGRVGR